MPKTYRIAVIEGDGIGKEVVPEGIRVLERAAALHGLRVEQQWHDFASCDYYLRHGRMMPEDWKERIGHPDAIFFGCVGWPQTVPDHVSVWGSLLLMRREYDQYVNLRPTTLLPGLTSPLAGRGPGSIDIWTVRENTEGEYTTLGGRMFTGTDREVVIQETVMTRIGVDRILRYAFALADRRPARHLTSATKSNGMAVVMPFWDERVEAIAQEFPDVRWDRYHADILGAKFTTEPDRFDVVVGSNLFGDLLSDLAAAITGAIGLAPSANINPEGTWPSLFEAVHGSAPDIAGQGIANPIGQIWTAALMLDHWGEFAASTAVMEAIKRVLAEPKLLTPDLNGPATTVECGKAIAEALQLYSSC